MDIRSMDETLSCSSSSEHRLSDDEKSTHRSSRKVNKHWRPRGTRSSAAIVASISEARAKAAGDADAYKEVMSEKKTPENVVNVLDEEMCPVPLFHCTSWREKVVTLTIPCASGILWWGGMKKYALALSTVSLAATAYDLYSRYCCYTRAKNSVSTLVSESAMISRVRTRGMLNELAILSPHLIASVVASTFSLLPTACTLPFGYVIPVRHCPTSSVDTRLLSNKNSKLDKDVRTIYEVEVDRVGSRTTAFVSPDVLSQLGVRAEHLTDEALEPSLVSICGAVSAVNVHTSMAWNVYQDSALVGALIIRHNRRMRRSLLSSPKNSHWVTPLIWSLSVTVLVTSPFLILDPLHRLYVWCSIMFPRIGVG